MAGHMQIEPGGNASPVQRGDTRPAASYSLIVHLGADEHVRGRYRARQLTHGTRSDLVEFWRIELWHRSGSITDYLLPSPMSAIA